MTAAPPRVDSEGEMAPVLADEVIAMESATMRFGDVTAAQAITLRVARGTILGIIGPSGAGKTTTIRMLTGALEPTEGRVRVLGEDPRRFHRRTRERIGYMPQLFTLYPDLTAGENVDFVASLFGLLWRRRRKRVEEVLHLVDLWPARKRRASDLSGGMQRRLELACALVHEPELLFLDEPTAGIDPLLRARVWEELHRLRSLGRTLLVTTQYVNEAEECDYVALIAHGRLVALAPPEEVRRQATGGDVIEIETERPFDGGVLERIAAVRAVNQLGPRSLRVVVDDAGVATPLVSTAIDEAGGEVVTSREYRPSFDEVFAELVERDRRAIEAEEQAADRHVDNESAARDMVERELRQRRADARTVPLDERAEAAETDGREPRGRAGDVPPAAVIPPAAPLARDDGEDVGPATRVSSRDSGWDEDAPIGSQRDAADPAATDPLALPGSDAPLSPEERAAAEERQRLDAIADPARAADPGPVETGPAVDARDRHGDR